MYLSFVFRKNKLNINQERMFPTLSHVVIITSIERENKEDCLGSMTGFLCLQILSHVDAEFALFWIVKQNINMNWEQENFCNFISALRSLLCFSSTQCIGPKGNKMGRIQEAHQEQFEPSWLKT